MVSVSDMIKQLEVKASKYDELISDLSELLSKYSVEVISKNKLDVVTKHNDKPKRNYLLWRCELNDYNITMKPRGIPIQAGCGKWSIFSTKNNFSDNKEIMPTCRYCGRKKRLTLSTPNVYQFNNREDALKKQYKFGGKD